MHQQHYFYKAFGLVLTFILSLLQSVHAAPDIVAQNYAAANSPGVSSCTAGYDLMSGDVAYSKPQIVGKLPFALNYRAPLRQNLSAAQSFAQPEQTSMGWTHNYQSYVIVQNISVSTATYRQYQANRVSNGYYDLTTFDPITSTNSAKEIIVRLPGESSDTLFKEQNGSFTRLYSADAIRDMNNYSMQSLPWNADLGEYSLSRSGGILTITKSGVSYTVTSDSYTISPSQSQTSTTNMYIGNDFNGYLTSQSWSINNVPNGAISDTAPYIETTTTVSVALQRITSVAAQGQTTSLQYDANLNLTQVTDNFNNKLVFEHNYDDTSVGNSQTIDESRLITKVTYTSGSQANIQVAEFNYQSYATKFPSTGNNWTVFALTSSNSMVSGSYTYNNEMTELGAMKAYIASKGRTADLSYYYPVLKQVINVSSKIEQQWDITQNYLLTGLTYSTASTAIKAYVGGILLSESTYDDVAKTITTTHQLGNGSPGTSSVQTTINSDQSITIGATGYPCLSSGGKPISSMEFSTARSRLTKTIDRNNTVFKYEYDNAARVKKIIEAADTALSRETSYEYGPLANNSINNYAVPTMITGPNLGVTNTLNGRGQITKQVTTSPQGGSSTRTVNYDYYEDTTKPNYGLLRVAYGLRDGQQVGSIAQFLDKIEYTYDAWGNVATTKSFVSNMHSGTTTERITQYFDYNSAGLPDRKTDPDGKTTFYTYNAAYQLTNQNYAYLAGTSNTYNDLSQRTSSTDADGKTTSYSYDDLGRVIRVTKPAGNYISYEYYPNSIVKHERHYNHDGALAEETSQLLDGNGRLSSTWKTNATWLNISYGYDANGNVTSQTDANGIVEKWTYDAFNRVKTHTNGNGKVDSKEYDISDNVIRITDPNNNTAQHDYKNTNTLMHDINSELPMKRYWHDDSENNTKYQFGNRSCYYNDIDQIGRVRYSDCIDETNNDANLKAKTFYGWDDLNDRILNVVDETQGSFSDKGVNTYYEYDGLGRISKKRQLNKTPKQWGYPTTEQSVSYNYTTASRIQGITYPSGNRVEYGYSPAGRLDNITLNGGHVLCAVDWDGADRLRGWAWGCQDQHRYSLHIGLPGIVENVINKINGQNQFTEVYTRDAAGRIVSKFMNDNHTKGYKYDNAGQLTSECHGQAANGTCYIGMTYTYDNNGNRLTKAFNTNNPAVALPANESYGYWRNVLTSWTIGGSAVALQTTAYQEVIDQRIGLPYYDFAGRRKLEGGVPGSTKYTSIWNEYNHKNERTFRGGSYLDRQYVYDESSHLIGEYKPDGSLIVEYIWMGNKPVAAIYPGSKVYWIVTDHQNTPRRLIDRDNQSTVWTWDSDAFGVSQPVGSVEMNLRFPGQYYDEQSKLYYNHNRYYNPELGRYMEPDPIGLEGGLNMFAYAGSNPVMNVDPSGLASVGQILDDSAMRAASLNNTLQLAALSFAKVTWDVFGAENISRWADGQITSRIGLGIETAAAIPFVGPAAKVIKAADGLEGIGKYSVGAYNEIKGTVKGLDAHHVGQKAVMGDLIPAYNPMTAPSILVPKVGHTIKGPNGIVSRSTDGLLTPRAVVARDIMELRRVYPDIPNSQLQQLIKMNKDMYPGYF